MGPWYAKLGSLWANFNFKKFPRKPLKNQKQLTRISYIKQRRNKLGNLQLGEKIENTIKENINGGSARHNKAAIPPRIIFSAQQEIRHHNR